MSPAARFHDVTALGIGCWIGAAVAENNGGLLFVGLCVAVAFIVARAIGDHYVKRIDKLRAGK